jgi:antitoxin VapB
MLYSRGAIMANTARARVFMSGRSQHVTIPAEYRFRSSQVSIRRNEQTGEVILAEIPNLEEVFAALDAADLPEDFMNPADRDMSPPQRRPALDALFAGDDLDAESGKG